MAFAVFMRPEWEYIWISITSYTPFLGIYAAYASMLYFVLPYREAVKKILRNKNLHSPCNILIAVQAVCEGISQLSQVPYIYFAFNEYLVSFYTCYYINILFMFTLNFNCLLIVFIALDRFVASKHPIFYNNLRKRNYICGILTVCFIYGGLFQFALHSTLSEEQTMCVILESMTGSITYVWWTVTACVYVVMVAIYVRLLRIFKEKKGEYEKVNRSISFVITFYICGYLFVTVVGSIVGIIAPDHNTNVALLCILGISCNINAACPFFIYYFRSTTYRKAFDNLIGGNKKPPDNGSSHMFHTRVNQVTSH
ncbi:hypothetical protein QR680_015659 [Steinernema hermaphroditum]|uniref:G-protein coupled receptors family 1 profile domain-containing protein n=1 Tax=Steinernema hermaphroditum TaxID=289476 RepID=A0AA39H9J4_9BILA|nr:hypothetical protein QR680_015659 [Steinernema hermaphroditum]